jgi:hypothetical protein
LAKKSKKKIARREYSKSEGGDAISPSDEKRIGADDEPPVRWFAMVLAKFVLKTQRSLS